MVVRRNKFKPQLKIGIWIRRDDLYFVLPDDLNTAIIQSGRAEDVIRKELGAGNTYLENLYLGNGIELMNAWFVESIISQKESTLQLNQPIDPPQIKTTEPKENEVAKLFNNLKYDVRKKLREASARDRRDSALGFDLQRILTWLEELESIARQSPKERDTVKVRKLWREVAEIGKKYKIFNRYDGNIPVRVALIHW
jgi:hypothetical protein